MIEHKIFLSEVYIKGIVDQLSKEIKYHFNGKKANLKAYNSTPVFLGVMNGALYFLSDLTRAYSGLHQIHTIKAVSYKKNTQLETVEIIGDLSVCRDRDVVIVDTIVDSGKTIKKLLTDLEQVEPNSVVTCCLVLRDGSDFTPDFIGAKVQKEEYLVGYGLDDNGVERNNPFIYSKTLLPYINPIIQ